MRRHQKNTRWGGLVALTAAPLALAGMSLSGAAQAAVQCVRTVTADVVVIDQPLMFNRMGAQNVNGMMYALRRDVVNRVSGMPLTAGGAAVPGNVELRPDKRARPIVLRVGAGDCLTVHFTNLLDPTPNPLQAPEVDAAGQVFELQIDDQVVDRVAGFHPQGLELVGSIDSDSSFVGNNASSLVAPGQSATYDYYAPEEGTFLVVSDGAVFGGQGAGGNIAAGLFGVVNVQPQSPGGGLTRFYRSQVNEEDMRLATVGTTADGQPILDYEALYPDAEPFTSEGKAGYPILNMLTASNELVHTDINAVIAGPLPDGRFPADTYPLESVGMRNPTVPNRLEAFREFSVVFHDETVAAQAFPQWYADPVLSHTLHGVGDVFMVNYGSGGIGSEIIANRLGVGPMHDCLTCSYEEFFLTAFTVADVGQLVDVPANAGLEACTPDLANCEDVGPKASYALYPDDPSNVHHSYMNDFVKFRNVHAGPKEQHVFHLHNHQWLFNANDDNSNYLDAQGVGPGSGYTYEINFGGSGNRNKSAGDAIFHCHFYPHFAQGMWEMWRIHDVLETGTELAASEGGIHSVPFALGVGLPAAGARALPDGEIVAGTPIPALVPLPGLAMAPVPAQVTVVANTATTLAAPSHPTPGAVVPVGSLAAVDRGDTDPALVEAEFNPTGLRNPGYPFWIAGIETTVGQRPPTPPLDMFGAKEDASIAAVDGGWDGGLPRHTLGGYADGGVSHDTANRLDFSKVVLVAKPYYLPEEGTDVERAAMAFHAVRNHGSTALKLDGSTTAASFTTNGAPPIAGAPFHEPCVDDEGDLFLTGNEGDFFDGSGGLGTKGVPRYGQDAPRVYKAANVQFDAVFNKAGYHFPQQRILALWEDVVPTIEKTRAPEPLVMRLNTYDCANYLHTNLVPEAYEMDDYQVRTPTDIIGQHIHLPKWDLTTTDGAGNGWNYEDGTLSPGAVRERIEAINHWVDENAPGTPHLEPEPHPYFGQFTQGQCPGGLWCGARTTRQRWFADPVVNVQGEDRGLGIIFTHDHYGPSTHQQIGLYATVLTEPAGSEWVHSETGEPLYTRPDGGPTSWQAVILRANDTGSHTVAQFQDFREFYLEFSDFQHAYQPGVYIGANQQGEPFDTRTDPAPGVLHHGAVQLPDPDSFRDSINPSVKVEIAGNLYPDLFRYAAVCPGGVPRPCPEAISLSDPGMLVVNYRNEPQGLRVYDPDKPGPDGKLGTQADGLAGDLAFAMQSRTDRAIPEFNVQPDGNTVINGTAFPPPTNRGLGAGDPFTPMLRVYEGDRVHVKMQAGGHEEEHNAYIQGLKWLQGGSGHGEAKNSGWRNSQAIGISEQFSLRTPVSAAPDAEKKAITDYAYTTHGGMDGWWSGVWGVMRAYTQNQGTAQGKLFQLPGNKPQLGKVENPEDFAGVCPASAPGSTTPASLVTYRLVAMTANELLGNDLGVAVVPGDSSATMHEGAVPEADGGTLVYNHRDTAIPSVQVVGEGGVVETFGGHAGPLHDPTGLMLVRVEDLQALPGQGALCADAGGVPGVANPSCAVRLRDDAPVEPAVIRASAGDCVDVTLYNRLPVIAPDLASLNSLMGVVPRDRLDPQGMTTFHNNLIRPSSHVGLVPGLVTVDGASVGANVGVNDVTTAAPGASASYRWYMGDLESVPTGAIRSGKVQVVATPIEFGGANLMPADKVKQGQKGLVGALVVEPAGATWVENGVAIDRQDGVGTRPSRAQATVTSAAGSFVDMAIVMQKGQAHRYADGASIENLEGGAAGIAEDSQDMGTMAINGGSEPLWFRLGLAPNLPFGVTGLGGTPDAHEAFSNTIAGGADPVTPVFVAGVGQEARMRVLLPHGAGRGTTFNVHGHVWQRDPYVCAGSADLGLVGKCVPGEVGSTSIGDNPLGMGLGGQESVNATSHFEARLPLAGGSGGVTGDYLFRDQSSFGIIEGLWGIMRVQ